jgi:UDP:flavonoid glycosyltransferase YjiC (YdhE family)
MAAAGVTELYNYDEFVAEKYERWLNFSSSPPLGQKAPDFTLWSLDDEQTILMEVLGSSGYTVVEFGSFT